MNFYTLMKNREIAIPIIQRDYAHGRVNDAGVASIRDDFIEAVFNSLLPPNKKLDLNFIYGNEIDSGFLPIDGQQRLTSLYLICWFCAAVEDKLDLFLSEVKKFSYQIRRASIEFFEALRDPKHSDNFKTYAADAKNTVRLDDFGWFKTMWGFDPTVNGATVFLDNVRKYYHSKVKVKAQEAGISLTEIMLSENCPIRFMYFPLEKPKDDSNLFEIEHRAAITYINMNARGKPLSDFENLKALIHGSGKDGKEFADNYEKTYINIFLSMVKGDDPSLEGKIKKMDEHAKNLLLFLYRDLSMLQGLAGDGDITIYDMMSRIRQNDPPFPAHYFEFIKHVMSECGNTTDTTKRDKVYNYCIGNLKYDSKFEFFNTFWYDFRLKRHSGLMSWTVLWKHLENNDEQRRTNDNSLKCLYTLVESMAGSSANSIIDFLAKTDPAALHKEKNISSKISLATLMEEHLKAKICIDQNGKEDKTRFNLLESVGERHDHRLRYLLYISGYWTNNGNWNDFEDYAEMDKVCAPRDSKMSWQKLFYVYSVKKDKTQNTYTPAESKLKPYYTKWNPNCLSWNKANPDEEERLERIKAIYDDILSYLSSLTAAPTPSFDLSAYIDNTIKNSLHPSCWLYYVLDRDDGDLLLNVVEKNGTYYYYSENFFTFVLNKDFTEKGYTFDSVLQHAMDEITVNPPADPRFTSKKRKNMRVNVYYKLEFNNISGYKLRRKDGVFHKFKYASITSNNEDAFDWEIDNSTYNAQQKVFYTLFGMIEGLFAPNNVLGSEAEHQKLVFEENFVDLAKHVNTVLNTINTQHKCNIVLCPIQKSGQRDIIIPIKQSLPFTPSAQSSASTPITHSTIISKI